MRHQDQPSPAQLPLPLPGKKAPPLSPKDADENLLKMKHFMSPTTSKVNNQSSRKKILGDRSESPIRSFKDDDENLSANQEMGRPDADNLQIKPTHKHFMSPTTTKSTASKVNRPIAIPSSPKVLNFDLMNANEESGEETADWSPFSYDPVKNYLVPRPQFLRYRPNRLGLLEPSAKKETDDLENEDDEDSGSDDDFDEDEFDEIEMGGSSICRKVLQFVLVLAVLVLSSAYITSMNDDPVEIDGRPNYNYAAFHLHNQETKSYPVAFVSRLEVNGSWLSLDEEGTPSQLEMVKPHIPLDEAEEMTMKEIPKGEEVAMKHEVQEEGELLSFQQPLFLPLQEAQSLCDGRNDQMDASMEQVADEMVREIEEPNGDDGVTENGKVPIPRVTTTEVEEEKYGYMELNKKLAYDLDVDHRPFHGPMLAVIAVASCFVLVLLLFCGVKRKGKNAAARNDGLLPRSSNDPIDAQQPPPHSEAPLSPPQDPIDASIPERRVAALKSSGAPIVELLGEIEGMGSISIGGGVKLKPEKEASHVRPAATVASASRNSTATNSDRKSTNPSSSSSSSRKKEAVVVGGEREAKSSTTPTTVTTPLRRSNRLLASRGITSP